MESMHKLGNYKTHKFSVYGERVCFLDIYFEKGIEVYICKFPKMDYSNFQISIDDLISKRDLLEKYVENPWRWKYELHYFKINEDRFDFKHDFLQDTL